MTDSIRLTDLTLGEIEAALNDPKQSKFKPCQLANDLGIVTLSDNEKDSAEAQRILVKLLTSQEESLRWIAIRFLMTAQVDKLATERTNDAVALFQALSTNASIVPSEQEIEAGSMALRARYAMS